MPSGPGLVALAGAVLAIGYAYDLRAKGTAWSWLPFAIGIPLLPVFAWFGTTGELPGSFAILLPAAVAAGAALAIANALADVERDRAAGLRSVALRLGPERAWTVQAVLLAAVVAAALVSSWADDAGGVAMVVELGAGPGHRGRARPVAWWRGFARTARTRLGGRGDRRGAPGRRLAGRDRDRVGRRGVPGRVAQ